MGVITTSISSSTGTLGVTGSVSLSGSGASGSTAIYSSSYGHTLYSSTGSYTSGSSGVTEISGGCVYITGSSPAVVITAGDLIVSGNCYLGDALTDVIYIRSMVTASEGISINLDNRAVTVGSAQDLLIYHDGSDSIIKNNTGHILIDNNVENKHIRLKLGEDDSSTQIQVRNNSNNTVLKMDALGALSASNGITGSSLQIGAYGWTNSGVLTIDTLSANSFSSTSLSASTGITGSSLQVGAYGWTNDGRVTLNTLNAAGTVSVAEKIEHAGDTDTYISLTDDDINFQAGGVNFLDLTEDTQNEVTFNEGGVDVDFRVESENDTHMLFVDGANDAVSIGVSTDAPAAVLEVVGDGAAAKPTLSVTHAENTNNAVNITADSITTAKAVNISADA